jgi:hypothetical protein
MIKFTFINIVSSKNKFGKSITNSSLGECSVLPSLCFEECTQAQKAWCPAS